MVSKEEIEAEGMTKQEVLDVETVQPRTEVEWVPEWDEHPSEQPGENTRIEDDTLIWERDGFAARLESYETTHWKATVELPSHVGELYPREIDLKASPKPEHGFVESVAIEGYEAAEAVLILQANYQPTYEVNKWINYLLEQAEESHQFRDDLEEKLSAAAQSED